MKEEMSAKRKISLDGHYLLVQPFVLLVLLVLV